MRKIKTILGILVFSIIMVSLTTISADTTTTTNTTPAPPGTTTTTTTTLPPIPESTTSTTTTTTTTITTTTTSTTTTTTSTAITPILAFGGRGSDKGEFDEPHGISIESNGKIYVLDTLNTRVQIFNSTGKFSETFGGYDKDGITLGRFEDPEGIFLVEFNENLTKLYITDTRNHRVQIRTANKTFSNATNSTITTISWVEFGKRCYSDVCNSTANVYLDYPSGIAVDDSGVIYLADTGNDAIKIVSSENKLIREFDGINTTDGRFKSPKGVAVGGDGRIYVTDTGQDKIRIFLSDGSQIRSFGGSGSEIGRFSSPSGIALDKNDNIYVADTGNSRIQIFDSLGGYVTQFGSENCTTKIYSNPTNYTGFFCNPEGIAVDSSRIYVSDTGGYRVQVFSKPEFKSRKEVTIFMQKGWNLISIPLEQ